MTDMGSAAHQALIDQVTGHYEGDPRVLAVTVFGSVSAGTWHDLSDVDLDIVVADDVVIDPEAEVRAVFGSRAAIVTTRGDCADIVLDSAEEASVRWHPLAATSPNVTATLRSAAGPLPAAEVVAAGHANRAAPDESRLLDTLAREAVGAWKAHRRGRRWEAVVAVERARSALTALRLPRRPCARPGGPAGCPRPGDRRGIAVLRPRPGPAGGARPPGPGAATAPGMTWPGMRAPGMTAPGMTAPGMAGPELPDRSHRTGGRPGPHARAVPLRKGRRGQGNPHSL